MSKQEKKWIEFDLNDLVKVKLTELGENILHEERKNFNAWLLQNKVSTAWCR